MFVLESTYRNILEKVENLEKQVETLKNEIISLEEENKALENKVINGPVTKKDVQACKKMGVLNGVANRYIFCRNNKYAISMSSSYASEHPGLFVEFCQKKGYEKEGSSYWVSLNEIMEYLEGRSYFVIND